jgi:aromatic ring-opening dioxygenase catalytic subunit (LigB family)
MLPGWDHGVFIPMILVNPKADIPIVQVSVLESEDPSAHFAMGRALGKLRDSNIAIIGSGFASFHNLRLLRSTEIESPAFVQRNMEWNKAVAEAALEETASKREDQFKDWRSWPASHEMHPSGGGEHFLPLIVCAGAGGDGKAQKYADKFMGMDMYSFYWS